MYGFEEWIKKIVERLEELLKEKRSILIICESIDDANSIYQAVGNRGLKTSRI
jgi:CRISPR/Cas system-associated endonuclease/helicase Cas3